jgi:hypothetical protein
MAAEAVPIHVLLARASSFYQWALEYRRAHPETEAITELVDEALGLLTLVHAEYIQTGRAF